MRVVSILAGDMDGQNFFAPELHIPEDPNFKDENGLLASLSADLAVEIGSRQDEEVCINHECSSLFWKLPDKKLNRKYKRNNSQEKACVKIPKFQ